MGQYQDTLCITHLFLQYSEKQKENIPDAQFYYDELFSAIRKHVYTYPQRLNSHNTLEISSEFLIFMENKINSYISNFEYTGVPFEYYLNTILKFQFYSFLKQYKQEIQEYKFFENASVYNILDIPTYTNEQSIKYEKPEMSLPFAIKTLNDIVKNSKHSKAFKKRLWWFTLKYMHILKESNITILLQTCEESMSKFLFFKSRLKKHITAYEEKIHKIRIQKNLYFSKCRKIELRLEETLTNKEYEKLQNLLQKYKARYQAIFEKYERYSVQALISNEELSQLLHVPKGTIDSGLYFFHIKCKEQYKNHAYTLK